MKDDKIENIVKLITENLPENDDGFCDHVKQKLIKTNMTKDKQDHYLIESCKHLYNQGSPISLKFLKCTLDILEKTNFDSQFFCNYKIGSIYQLAQKYDVAIVNYKNALSVSKHISNNSLLLDCLNDLTSALSITGEFGKAIPYLKDALNISENIQDFDEMAFYLSKLGGANHYLGNYTEALKYHELSINESKLAKKRMIQAICHEGYALTLNHIGKFQEALDHHNKALEIAYDVGSNEQISMGLINRCSVYLSLGDVSSALEDLKKALKIMKNVTNKKVKLSCYGLLANTHFALNDVFRAVGFHLKSIELAKEINDRFTESVGYLNLSNPYIALEEYDKAEEYLQKSLSIKDELDDKPGRATCLMNLAVVQREKGKLEKAFFYAKQGLDISLQIQDARLELENRVVIGYIAFLQKNYDLSYQYLQPAIGLSEKLGKEIIKEDHKIGFYGKHSDMYELIAIVCYTLNKLEESFSYVERGKARAFMDMMSKNTKNEQNLDIDGLNKNVLNLSEIKSKLDANSLVIEYFLTINKIIIFAITKESFDVIINDIPKQEVIKEIKNFQEEIEKNIGEINSRQNPSHTIIDGISDRLSKYLIQPISDQINKKELVYFVPTGILNYIPFQVLKLNNKYIAKEKMLTLLPNASFIQFFNNHSQQITNCVSIGIFNEKKEQEIIFKREAEEIAELFCSKAFININKDNVKELFKRESDAIHFSCHGKFDPINPILSKIQLQNSEITAKDISQFTLNSKLITLSTCESGKSELKKGDEIIGFVRTLLYAGTSSVLVSLWSVEAISTKKLMVEFYKNLKDGNTKTLALQKAQIKIMDDYPHPYFWAPFILVGNPN